MKIFWCLLGRTCSHRLVGTIIWTLLLIFHSLWIIKTIICCSHLIFFSFIFQLRNNFQTEKVWQFWCRLRWAGRKSMRWRPFWLYWPRCSLFMTTPDICQFNLACNNYDKKYAKIANSGQNGPKIRVLLAKKYTGSKKVHHCRLWRLWLISAMFMIAMVAVVVFAFMVIFFSEKWWWRCHRLWW